MRALLVAVTLFLPLLAGRVAADRDYSDVAPSRVVETTSGLACGVACAVCDKDGTPSACDACDECNRPPCSSLACAASCAACRSSGDPSACDACARCGC